jgi:acyl dehydratase
MSALDVGQVFAEHGPVLVELEDMVRWAAASGDFTTFHYDADAAAGRGFPAPVVHGPWKAAMLRSLVPHWLGEPVSLREFSASYLAPDFVGRELVFGGEIDGLEHTGDGALSVRCSLWAKRQDGTVSVAATCLAVTAAIADEGLPIERLKQAVRLGEIAGTFEYRVDRNDIELFAEAVGATPRPGIAPATFFAALDPVERRDLDLDAFLQTLPFPMKGGGNAFNEVEYQRPVRAGDVITVTTRYTEVYEKKGSRGTLLFRVRENELRDAAGELVATTRCGHVLTFVVPEGVGA